MPSTNPHRHQNAPLELTIRNRGLRDRGLSGIGLLAVILGVAALVGAATDWTYGLAVAGVLTAAAWRNFLFLTFEFGPLGVAQRHPWLKTRRVAWNEMGRIEFLREGLLITVNPQEPLSRLRSVYIRYAGKRSELERVVQTYVPPQQSLPSEPASTDDFSLDQSRT